MVASTAASRIAPLIDAQLIEIEAKAGARELSPTLFELEAVADGLGRCCSPEEPDWSHHNPYEARFLGHSRCRPSLGVGLRLPCEATRSGGGSKAEARDGRGGGEGAVGRHQDEG